MLGATANSILMRGRCGSFGGDRSHSNRGRGRSMHRRTTRKQFLVEVAGIASSVPSLAERSPSERPKVLAVVAHPDDEYAFAAFAYRLTHEAHGTVDQVIITNGEAGFRYSQLAESFYGLRLTDESVGRDRLPAIRRQETERAGRILGIRRHSFLQQRDARFTLDSREAFRGVWDTKYVTEFITTKLKQEQYDFVVIMLPTEHTHGHHQAAALITAEAIGRLAVDRRPVLIAAEASATEPPAFRARPDYPVLRSDQGPQWRLNRHDPLPDQPSLNYNVIVNWVIAEHKSQGLFQTESGRHAFENFWLFETDTPNAAQKADDLFASLTCQIRSRR